MAEPTLDGPLGALERLLAKLADKLDDGRPRDELLEQKTRIKGLQAGLTEWLTLAAEGHVYWAERGGRKQTIVGLRSAPIDEVGVVTASFGIASWREGEGADGLLLRADSGVYAAKQAGRDRVVAAVKPGPADGCGCA